MKQNTMGWMAIGVLALLFGGSVAALSMNNVSVANIAKVEGENRIQIPATAEVTTTTVVQTENRARVDAQAALREDVQTARAEERAAFAERVRALRGNIRTYVDERDHEGNGFLGLSYVRVVLATDLSWENKLSLLRGIWEGTHNEDYDRQNMVMWSLGDETYVSIAKVGGSVSDGMFEGAAIGFSSESNARFHMYLGNGLIAGKQGDQIFWGTYDAEGNFNLRHMPGFEGGVSGTFSVY